MSSLLPDIESLTAVSPSSDQSNEDHKFKDNNRASSLLDGFSALYKNKQFVDVVLYVGEKEFPCHKNVLGASSPYFLAMFSNNLSENRDNRVHLKDMEPQTVQLVLDYIYTGEVSLSEDSVQHLLSAANLFQLISLRHGCAEYMIRHVSVSNCIGMYFFAKAHECEELAEKAKEIINNRFAILCKEQEFLSLPCDKLIEITSDNMINVEHEERVYEACLAWLDFDLASRQNDLEKVMNCVRFANISSYYFCDRIDPNPLFQNCPSLQKILKTVRYFHMLKNRQNEMDLNFMPRNGMTHKRALIIIANPYSDDVHRKFNSMEALIPETGEVKYVCKLPQSLYMPGCAITGDNQIFLAGGAIRKVNYRGTSHFEGFCNTVYMYEQLSGSWTVKAAMNEKRHQFSLTVVDGYLYAIGGMEESLLTSVERYSLDSNFWEPASPLPKPLRCMTATSYKGKVYVFGGESTSEITKTAYRYDPVTAVWTQLPDMITPRALSGSIVYKDKIYVIGGNSAISEKWKKEFLPEHCVSSVEVFDPHTDTWSQGPDLPNALCGASVVKYDNTIMVIGGEDEKSWMAGLFYLQEDPSSKADVWIEGQELSTVMSTFGCVIANIPSEVMK